MYRIWKSILTRYYSYKKVIMDVAVFFHLKYDFQLRGNVHFAFNNMSVLLCQLRLPKELWLLYSYQRKFIFVLYHRRSRQHIEMKTSEYILRDIRQSWKAAGFRLFSIGCSRKQVQFSFHSKHASRQLPKAKLKIAKTLCKTYIDSKQWKKENYSNI